jgi:hypothetical protein
MQDTTSSWRRWRQFSLRTLLATTFLCALGLAFWVILIQPYRKVAEVIARLKMCRAVVTTETDGPAWLLAVAGKDFCLRIVQVEVDDSKFNDGDLMLLAAAPQLRMLTVGEHCKITADGLRRLEQARNLTDVMIANPAITDEALAHFGRMKQLEHLSIGGVFTDEGVKRLSELRGLRQLALRSPHVTNGALPVLSGLTELRGLRLVGRFSDAGMVHLQPLVNLEMLSCSGDPTKAAIFAALEDSAQMEFIEVPLTDIAEFLTDFHRIPVRVDGRTIASAGHGRDFPLTSNIKSKTLRDALNQLLEPTSFGWRISDNAILMTTKEAVERSRPNTLALQRKLKNLKDLDVEW